MDLTAFYEGPYVDASYGEDGIEKAFEHINALDPSKSDNEGRVRRVLAYGADHFKDRAARSILDVGSGIGVFCHRMKAAGWQCTALDPDPRSARHAAENVGVQSFCGDFMNIDNLGRFDVVTFNRVLEHLQDPVAMLARALNHVSSEGFVYIELPDGEEASLEGYQREEFFIEHYHIFSKVSATLLAERTGYTPASVERLREPSCKYTLRAFLIPARNVQNHGK
jgi:SAM-dependent methyltransferase